MKRHGIPTAAYATFTDPESAKSFLAQMDIPVVIKADGLAAGKGVVIAQSQQEAEQTIDDMLSGNAFGTAGSQIVIEEYLQGEEVSFIVMCDGHNILPLATSQDHKARDNGDRGPNTGGMGAYSPAPIITPEIQLAIMDQVIEPTIQGLAKEGITYQGFLYAGLIIDPQGNLKVLEYNCRLGDPEAQVILMRLQSDLFTLGMAGCDGQLDQINIQWDQRASVGVVLAAGGYPNDYRKGDPIIGVPRSEQKDKKIFIAGAQLANEQLITSGGRVLCVAALGNSVAEAQQEAYNAVSSISWPNMYYRTDIAHRAINRQL